MVGNGVTDESYDGNALVPFAHGMGLISNDLYQVNKFGFSSGLRVVLDCLIILSSQKYDCLMISVVQAILSDCDNF